MLDFSPGVKHLTYYQTASAFDMFLPELIHIDNFLETCISIHQMSNNELYQ